MTPTTSQPAIATQNRRKGMKKAWSTKEWKAAKTAFLEGQVCSWCGSDKNLVPHHPFINSYKDGVYLDFYLSGCVVLCNRCHFALHKGLILCPVCKSKFCRHDSGMCYDCFLAENPGIKEQIEQRKAEEKALRKRLRKEQADKARAWKKAHPQKKVKP